MPMFAIPSLSAASVFQVVPWEYKLRMPKALSKDDKPGFIQWCQQPGTKHCFFSAFEGLTGSLRVSASENPPVYLHGFVADYDTKITPDLWTTLPGRCKTEFMPSHGSSTYSGGARIVWEFETPLLLSSWQVTKAFMKIAAKKMGMTKLLPGFDEAFYQKPDQYYEVGRDWVNLSTDKIPPNVLWNWMALAGDAVKEPVNIAKIPIPAIAAEVQKRWPGKWQGPFEFGSRGVRFWDAGADNSTAAIVRETGMQCFTGTRGFVTWAEIFGTRWVEKFAEDNMGNLLNDWWYDGTGYWMKDRDTGMWVKVIKEDFKLVAKVKYGLSTVADKKQTASEVDQIQYRIQTTKRLDGISPRVHSPDGVFVEGPRKLLNTSVVKCLAPAPDAVAWAENFPWIAGFLDTFFVEEYQQHAFMAWLKWFYQNGFIQKPRSGQAMFIAGDKGLGKTFLSTCIVSKMVGGHQDARSFFLGESKQFSDFVFDSPLLTMDDAEPASDNRLQAKFSNTVKRLVANPYQYYEKKFQTAGQTVWMGRIMVTCNLDQESLRILPSLEISNKDKVMLLRAAPVNEGGRTFLPFHEMQTVIDQELPHFCRWLLDWKIPDNLVGDSRFGVRAVFDSFLEESAAHAESSYAFTELLEEFRARMWNTMRTEIWEGNGTMLLSCIMATPDLEIVARPFADTRAINRYLGKLVTRMGSSVTQMAIAGNRQWRIRCHPDSWSKALLERYPEALKDLQD